MGFKGDIDEVERAWQSASWRTRIVLLLSLFIASGSVASISETVAKWKGFILDGIALYRTLVSEPLAAMFSLLAEIQISAWFADVISLAALILSAMVRAILHQYRNPNDRIFRFLFLVGVVGAQLVFLFKVQSSPPYPPGLIAIYASTVVYASLVFRGGGRMLAIAFLLIPPLAVGLVAAVSVGLSRAPGAA